MSILDQEMLTKGESSMRASLGSGIQGHRTQQKEAVLGASSQLEIFPTHATSPLQSYGSGRDESGGCWPQHQEIVFAD